MNLVNDYLRIFNLHEILLHSTLLSFPLFLSSRKCIQSSPSENSACESVQLSFVPETEAKKVKGAFVLKSSKQDMPTMAGSQWTHR